MPYGEQTGGEQTRRVPGATCDTLLRLLETLPDALFFLDEFDTIMYANASAQALIAASKATTAETSIGTTFWRAAPQLVSMVLYQAVRHTKQTRVPTEIEYRAPVSQSWLRVQLAATGKGLTVQFHPLSQPLPRRETFFSDEHLASAVLDTMHVGVVFLTPEGILLAINEAPLAEAQFRREEVIGHSFADTPWWSCSPARQEQLRAAIAHASRGETVQFETLAHPREGIDLYLAVTITAHRDLDHHVDYLVFVGTDITARKQAEGAIHTFIDVIPQLVWTVRPDGALEYHNLRWCAYTQLAPEQALGDGWMQCIHPEDRQRVWEAWQMARHTGIPFETEQRLRNGSTGAYRWFLVRAMPQKDAQGRIVRWVGTCTDIHDKKQAEDDLRTLVNAIPHIVWMMHPDGTAEYKNQGWCAYIGKTSEQLQGNGWLQVIHPEDRPHVWQAWQAAVETGTPYEVEHRIRQGSTGAYRWFLARGIPHKDEQSRIVRWVGTCTDIEEQKRTEQALRQSQQRIRALIDSSIIGIGSVEGEEEVFVEANEAYLQMTGYSQEDVRSRTLTRARLFPPEDAPLFEHAIQELAERGQHTPFETELMCKDGSRLPVVVGGVVFQHHPRQIISFVLDNSARKELEQRKDAFISMASHELGNPLTTLKLHTQLLQRKLAQQGMQDSVLSLSRMEAQINTLTRLVEELLDVSKIQAGRLEYRQEMVDLDELLQEIADILQQSSPSHSIQVQGATQTSLIGDRDRLGQVFTNLLSNAIKYSPDAQTVELELDASEETITVRVRDHGLGIPREQREKIFERFYRVPGPRQQTIAGLGMGLYIVAEIVKHHGGMISVESEVGRGSTFTVTFPKQRET